MSAQEISVEATGETVGEAKWAALRELEKQHPGLDKSAVHFQVVTEGERGLLGVGFAPAKVVATVSAAAAVADAVDESELAAETRELVTRIVDGIGVTGRIDVDESDEAITVSCVGSDLGMLIGRHGQTIDAVQYLANAVMWRRHPDDRKEVIVDAAGYRERRRVALEALALRSAERALSDHEPDGGREEGRSREAQGVRRGGNDERRHRAQPLRRRASGCLKTGLAHSSQRPV